MAERLDLAPTEALSLGLETNGKGYIGFVIELPGAFVRGSTEEAAISKACVESISYLSWLGIEPPRKISVSIVQTTKSYAAVEDGDSKILLDADKLSMSAGEFRTLIVIAKRSADAFMKTYESIPYKSMVDNSRIRETFYGNSPKTATEIFNHVNDCQSYYLSRIVTPFATLDPDFMKRRRICLDNIEDLYREQNNGLSKELDGELWTLKKVLRRFIWHDRIHERAMKRLSARTSQRLHS